MLNNKTTKRRVVYTILSRYITHQSLADALWLWEQQYAENSLCNLLPYMENIITYPEIHYHKGIVQRELLKGLHSPASLDLKPDPMLFMLKFRHKHNQPLPQADFLMVVFMNVLKAFIQESEQYHGNIRQQLRRDFKINGLSNQHLNDLLSVIEGQKEKLCHSYSQPMLKDILHTLYINICNILGPVRADTCLATAIQGAEKLPESKAVSPRVFL